MKYRMKDLVFADLTDSEKTQLKEDGFIGVECGDGYYARIVGIYNSDYKVSNGQGGQYDENFGVSMIQLVKGCLYKLIETKVFKGTFDNNENETYYIVKPTIASCTRWADIVVYDNLEDAVGYYTKLVNFGKVL